MGADRRRPARRPAAARRAGGRPAVVGGRAMPASALDADAGPARRCVVRFTPPRAARPAGRRAAGSASESSIELGGAPTTSVDAASPTPSTSRSPTTASSPATSSIGWPALSLWRAPTDNDDPPGEWRATTPAARLARRRARSPRRRRRPRSAAVAGDVTRVVGYKTGTGQPIEHRQRIEIVDGAARISEAIAIDRSLRDLPRVGVRVRAARRVRPARRGSASGPATRYPDRRAAVRFGRWAATVGELAVPFVRPQEYGLHLDTEWFELASPAVDAARRRRPAAGVLGAAPLRRGAGGGDPRPPAAAVDGDPRPPRRRPPRPRHGSVRSRHPSPSPRRGGTYRFTGR